MNKIKFSILVLITLFLSTTIFISCSKDETNQNHTSTNNESLLLKKAYGFESISYKIDKSNNLMFKSSTNLDKLTLKKSSKSQDLDLQNVTQINWANEKISYLIPFISNSSKSLVITIGINEIGNPLNLANAKIVENSVDPSNGNGIIILTDIEGSTKKTFENGVLKAEVNIYGKTFRQCFDQAYNNICDGLIGCAAWYSSPLPALTAIAYCGATT
nr:hypothetical protein [uncultured Flavobacterium sp.]